ncbi:LysM peptidoglycan-binding domain-containing protein [Deinococcus hopiensis]|nr:LysM peptidoglycan-binding domain-containing protein [Deinococcus hopiensis]
MSQASRHTVSAGETLYSISKAAGTTPEALMVLNGMTASTVYAGQALQLPDPPPPLLQAQHTVSAGETLYSIARAAGTTVPALVALNQLADTSISVGQVLELGGPGLQEGSAAPRLPAPAEPTGLEQGLFTLDRLPSSSSSLPFQSAQARRPAAAYLPEVGYEAQTLNNCGPAALAAALRLYGVEANQQTWQDRLRPTGGNMQFAPAQRLLAELGFRSDVQRGGTVEDVKRAVAQGFPVIVLQYHSVVGKTPHFRVVRGYDDARDILIMSDPLSGPNVALTSHDFDVLWNTQGRAFIPVRPLVTANARKKP